MFSLCITDDNEVNLRTHVTLYGEAARRCIGSDASEFNDSAEMQSQVMERLEHLKSSGDYFDFYLVLHKIRVSTSIGEGKSRNIK